MAIRTQTLHLVILHNKLLHRFEKRNRMDGRKDRKQKKILGEKALYINMLLHEYIIQCGVACVSF